MACYGHSGLADTDFSARNLGAGAADCASCLATFEPFA
ncbi:hypothetical protein SRCM100623_02943 [Acetobacter pasteurianus]|uniref:Uncharacterized protein n=1 Tax=Acetobacter pasteurianus TaxID=438 RepID=A0A1A0C896_ACEPA|nr:hypothetical protein SRCM100623_02943 [Acetobacter pasteurianus]GCD49895.1 hypothetical protein NBRC106471_1451 [Acetobacter pasteurianus subsp. pasteurianus LMG 1262 = NBRC 106471]